MKGDRLGRAADQVAQVVNWTWGRAGRFTQGAAHGWALPLTIPAGTGADAHVLLVDTAARLTGPSWEPTEPATVQVGCRP
ncbi:hypothetical protein [Streptomyces sp. NPDC001530]|uniref:hypothetical protein n=1 Tax=Streptomyces sp. NPDC001530 TaxID=3364582 RepID=UPI0036C4EDBC